MMQSHLSDDLERAREHVKEGERLVSEQRQRVAELARDGHNIDSAMRLLETLERTLEIMREHLELEQRFASGA